MEEKTKQIIRLIEAKTGKKVVLQEASYSRLMQTISGLVPKIESFGIVTWENPMAKQLSVSENKSLNKRLKERLKSGNFSYSQIAGKYEQIENPFFINNISKEDIIRLGKEGSQESIIFGVRTKDGMNISLLECETGNLIGNIKTNWKSVNQDADDYYSSHKGRKFSIPFFEGYGKIVETNNVFYEKDFKKEVLETLAKNSSVKQLLEEGRTGHSKFNLRGKIYSFLNNNKNS